MDYPLKISLNNVFTDLQMISTSDQSYFAKFFLQDFSPNTKKALQSDFRHFLVWYVGTNKRPFMFKQLTESDISGYKQICQQKHAVSTINRRITHLRMLCDFAIKEKRMLENPAKKIKLLRFEQLAPKSLDPADMRRLYKEAEIRGKARDILIIAMLSGAGFRVGELANLKIQDISLTERKGHALVRNSKHGKTREVPLHAGLRELLGKYITNRAPEEKLFKSQRGYLKPLGFNKIIDFYAQKAGIKCHPHQLRHTFSYRYLAQTKNDIIGLSQILGHSSISTSARYALNRLEDLQAKVESIAY